jgi:dolichyl-phosphate-mannose-protein mannosyltransferase
MAVLIPERTESAPEDPARRRFDSLPRPRRQSTPPLPRDRRLAAVLTAVLGLATLLTRLWDLNYPANRVFDEAYYPPEAREILELGYEYNRGEKIKILIKKK